MVKVIRLLDGTVICGDFNGDRCNNGLFIQYVSQKKSRIGINLAPIATLGDFDQPIQIAKDKCLYMYDADSEFVQIYRQHVIDVKKTRDKAKRSKVENKTEHPPLTNVFDIASKKETK